MSNQESQPVFNEQQQAVIKRVEMLVANEFTQRQNFFKRYIDPRRSINDECGYPETASITVQDHYVDMYEREGVPNRIVNILPDECWAVHPEVFETEGNDEETEFEQAWNNLSKSLGREEESFFVDNEEKSSPIWEILHRADRLCGIGSYGILLLEFDDGETFSQPVEPSNGKTSRQLLGVKAFDQSRVRIERYENDPSNPRYGKPTHYKVSFVDSQTVATDEIHQRINEVSIHHTRVIHIADNATSNDLFGIPRMLPVFNRILDLRKLYAGSAEMYWRGAFPGLSFESHPTIDPEDIETEELKDAMEQYMNTLQRYIISTGMSVKSLAPQVVSPNEQIDAQLEAICVYLGVPKRIFLGSERGELASSQDSKTHNQRLSFRQNGFITPKIIVPFINRLIYAGVLPQPVEGFQVQWPDMNELSEEEKTRNTSERVKAMVSYVSGDLSQTLMTELDFLTRELNYSAEEALEILENVMDGLGDRINETTPQE